MLSLMNDSDRSVFSKSGIVTTVLIIEDNVGDVEILKDAFSHCDLNSIQHVVNDGERALDFLMKRDGFEKHPTPDIIILDLHMPRVDGLQVLESLKAKGVLNEIPIIVFTGKLDQERRDICEQHGISRALEKPYTMDGYGELVEIVASILKEKDGTPQHEMWPSGIFG